MGILWPARAEVNSTGPEVSGTCFDPEEGGGGQFLATFRTKIGNASGYKILDPGDLKDLYIKHNIPFQRTVYQADQLILKKTHLVFHEYLKP